LIRDARPGDGAGLARIWLENAAYYVERFPEDFRMPDKDGLVEWLEGLVAHERSEDTLWLVAEIDDEVAGYVFAVLNPPDNDARFQMLPSREVTRLWIEALGTATAHQRRGVATRLVEAAEEWGRSRGAVVGGAETYLESEVSVPFWEQRMRYRRRSARFTKRL
jgi:GNAT superfamily N-acetyltransferase